MTENSSKTKVSVNNEIYLLDAEIWEKHVKMHPVRSLDAFLANCRICFGSDYENLHSSSQLEKMILDEYNIHNNMNEIAKEAIYVYTEEREE